MTRKWADQQEYVTRWKYVGAVPTFPQIHPAIIIESWICIWSRLTTPSFKTFFLHCLSHFVFHLLSTPDGKHQDLNKTIHLCFSLPSKFPFPYTLKVCTVLVDDNTIWISFVAFWWHGGPYNDFPTRLVSQHIACCIVCIILNLNLIKQTVVLVLLVFALARLEIQFGISC